MSHSSNYILFTRCTNYIHGFFTYSAQAANKHMEWFLYVELKVYVKGFIFKDNTDGLRLKLL